MAEEIPDGDKKISELPTLQHLPKDGFLVVVHGGATKKISKENLLRL